MRISTIRYALVGILLLGFGIPGAALAGDGGKGCSNIGTWFGVVGPGQTQLTGWQVTVTGKSSNEGTNLMEFPTFDPKVSPELAEFEPFKSAERIGNLRGTWKRTGGNTFDYTFMGFAFDASNMPAYIAKISGQVVLIGDCQYQFTTAVMEVFSPLTSPFDDEPGPDWVIPLGEFYGYRATVDLPY